jgi:hypothetical protein
MAEQSTYTPREQGLMLGVLTVGKLWEHEELPAQVNVLDAESLWRMFEPTLPLDDYGFEGEDAEAFRKGVRDGLSYGVVKAELAIAHVLPVHDPLDLETAAGALQVGLEAQPGDDQPRCPRWAVEEAIRVMDEALGNVGEADE